MEILVYPWNSYNYYDVERTLKKLGHNVTEIQYHIDDYDGDEGFLELLPRIFAEKKYDFVFSVNYFPVISDACEGLGVKYVCWTCDNPLILSWFAVSCRRLSQKGKTLTTFTGFTTEPTWSAT